MFERPHHQRIARVLEALKMPSQSGMSPTSAVHLKLAARLTGVPGPGCPP